MDFLKTLLTYMTLLTALGVQEGPAPETIATPTPLPQHITASPVPFQTAAPTATPAPTGTPGPELTPNRRYTQLSFGNSGANVKKLQNRLIELGYMPKGSADSSYGYQTYNAVKAFQKANGLAADGVAGPKTLTVLYEAPNVVAVVEATPVPTASPTPSLPPLATPDANSMHASAPAATLTHLDGAYIISGTDGKTLYYETLVDGQPAQVKPDLYITSEGAPVVSLAQLTDCLEGWTLMGSSADMLYALNACGYTVSIHLKADGASVLVDGQTVSVSAEDVFIRDSHLYVTAEFLRTALKADTVFDADEKSLVVFFRDKSVSQSLD